MPVAAEIAVSEVVRQNDDDIGRRGVQQWNKDEEG
jgi:hypothetical protein